MDNADFEKVFWVIQPKLMRYASAHLDPASAEDVVSATFVTLLQKELEPPQTASEEHGQRALAFKILNGLIANEYRSRGRRAALREKLVSDKGISHESAVTDLNKNSHDQLSYWLDKLSKKDKQIILLFNAGFDIEETADVFGISYSSAAKRRSRAKERLRKIIEEEGT